MRFTIEKADFLRGLGRIQAVVERRSSLPVLANALIRADGESLTMSATDLEVGMTSTHKARVETPGSVTLAAKKLYEIARELDEDEVTLSIEDGSRVNLSCGKASFSLLSIAPEEYPTLPGDSGASFVSLDASLLMEMIDATLYATSTDETRYNLNGVLMEGDGKGRVIFVATNGHRLAKAEKATPEPISFLDKGIIVPRKGVSEIRKLCEETDGAIELGLSEGFLLVRGPNLLLSCRLIDGEFPDYRQVIPDQHQIRVVVSRELLHQAVKRIALVAHERAGGFRLALEDGELELFAQNPDLGEAREKLAVEYQGDRFETGFNARYLQDALTAMLSKEILIELRDELTPAQLRPADDPDRIAVVMPMRI